MFGIGDGVYNENSSVFVVGDINAPNYATGSITFYSRGIWNNDYNELHFYQGGGTWKYIGNCNLGLEGETSIDNINTDGTDNGGLAANALAEVITIAINTVADGEIDEYGNSLSATFEATHTVTLLEDNLHDEDEGPA